MKVSTLVFTVTLIGFLDYELLIFSDTAQLGDPREFGFGLQVLF